MRLLRVFLIFALFIQLLFLGCAMGPVRYKSFGYHKYSTIELYKKSQILLKPFGLVFGFAGDVIISSVDTPVVILYSIPLVYTHGGVEGTKCKTPGDYIVMTVFFPVWYPLEIYSLEFGKKELYKEIFGDETGIFIEKNSKDLLKEEL